MIQQITINNFKAIEAETLRLAPLTLLTGLNSTGKSTCLQAILATLYYCGGINTTVLLSDYDFSFSAIRNRNVNAKDLKISIQFADDQSVGIYMNDERIDRESSVKSYDLEEQFYYLSANRLAYSKDTENMSARFKIGLQGEYVFGTFEKEKSLPIQPALVKERNSDTLSSQVNWWMTYILDAKFEMQTELITSNRVKVFYKSNELPNLTPQHLGVGVSYLAKILIMCLRANHGDVLMIESPEVHLHPAAQSRLGEFFAFIANAGVQLLVETHCENLINRIRYEVYRQQIKPSDIEIYYKGGVNDPFQSISVLEDGNFSTDFPEGFFDSTLAELLEMS